MRKTKKTNADAATFLSITLRTTSTVHRMAFFSDKANSSNITHLQTLRLTIIPT